MARSTTSPSIQSCEHAHVERNNHSFYRFRCTDCRALIETLSETARQSVQPMKNHTRPLAIQA
jgi:transposase-like protein